VFRGQNFFLKGRAPNLYFESYGGHKNLSEIIPTAILTGTISFSPSSRTISGTSTAFFDEAHIGQFIITLLGEIIVVEEVLTDTSLRAASYPLTTGTSVAGYRMPVLFDMDNKRGTLLSGNAIKFDKGTIIAVGSGTLRVNGSALAGTSLSATRTAKLALYNAATDNYSVFPLGFDGVPTGITATAVAGGTRGMVAGKYSLRIQKANSATGGYGNPSEKITVTIAAGERIRLTGFALTSDDIAMGWDSWRINGNRNGGSTALNDHSYANGAWYLVKTVYPATRTDMPADLLLSDLDADAAADDYNLEYLDAEIDGTLRILTFDNDDPPDAEFVGTVAGYPVLISCQGKGTPDKPNGTSPGAFIVPTKPANIEAAPLGGAVPLSPPETIIGMYMAAGRLYLLTVNSLPIAVFTADPTFPVATRPFWKSGFKNPYAICFVNGTLYGFTSSGATRSVEGGDEGSEQHTFAADMEEIMKNWDASRVFVVHDPANECVCFINSGAYKNSSGYWVSECYPYMLRQEAWNMPIIFSATTHDMVVTGAATVNGRMEFLAGGRKSGGTLEVNTYRFDDSFDGEDVAGYVAFQYSDDGVEDRPKKVKGIRITGDLTGASFGIHGTLAGEVIDVPALEAGNSGSKSGAIALTDSTDVTLGEWIPLNVPNLNNYTIRIDSVWDGTGARNRIDSVEIAGLVQGGRR
jgi:hypothetical protein